MRHSLKFSGRSAVLALLALTTLSTLSTSNIAHAQTARSASTVEAMLASAVQYEHAEGVPRNYPKAAQLYCQAAMRGNANAQFSLGWMYSNGRGVPRNDAVAGKLYAMAAKQGHVSAAGMLQFTPNSKSVEMPRCLTPEPVGAPSFITTPNSDLPAVTALSYSNRAIFQMVEKIAKKQGVDPNLVMAVIAVESGFNVNARSPKNAQGLMQLIPETAQRFNVKNTLNAEENISGGVAYLKWLLALFQGNVEMVAAAYNSGERTVEKYRGIPPFPETQNYVRKISRLYQKTNHPYQAGVVKASPFLANRTAGLQ